MSISTGPSRTELCGYSTERQDSIITPISGQAAANGFKGYFCARLDFEAVEYGIIQNGVVVPGKREARGPNLLAFVYLSERDTADIRIGTSFISVEQARANLDAEIPDDSSLESTAQTVRTQWAKLLDHISIDVGGKDDEEAKAMREVFWTGIAHSLQVMLFDLCDTEKLNSSHQYPTEQHEQGHYWSGYDAKVHEGESYTGYSIWVSAVARLSLSRHVLIAHFRTRIGRSGLCKSCLYPRESPAWFAACCRITKRFVAIPTFDDRLLILF